MRKLPPTELEIEEVGEMRISRRMLDGGGVVNAAMLLKYASNLHIFSVSSSCRLANS